LSNAAAICIAALKANSVKSWWSQEASVFKHDAVEAHRAWIVVGKPSHIIRLSIILKYINININFFSNNNVLRNFTNAFCDSLLKKDTTLFWKSWKSKSSVGNYQTFSIEGCSDPSVISEKIASFFSTVCSPNFSELGEM